MFCTKKTYLHADYDYHTTYFCVDPKLENIDLDNQEYAEKQTEPSLLIFKTLLWKIDTYMVAISRRCC
jgi:hypothetical protein